MPAAGVTLEGPIIKDKLSYLVSARRSWLDFFDNLFSEDNRMNHSTYDYNAKLSYNLSPKNTLRLMAYGAQDGYHLPYDESGDKQTILRWTNQAYQASFHTLYGKLNQTSSVSYTSYTNRANAFILGFDTEGYVRSGIHSLNAATEFTFSPENMYSARWGAKYTHRARIDLPSLLTNGTILPLPALRLPGFSNRLPHAKYRRIQASLFGTLRSRMETFSEERTNRGIGLL